MGQRRRNIVLAVSVVVLLLAGVGVVRAWQSAHRSPIEDALHRVPKETLRLNFTDWTSVRRQLDLEGEATAEAVQRLIDRSYDADLSAASSIEDSAVALQRYYGFSPATVSWEAYAQSREGAVLVLRLPDDSSMDSIAGRLDSSGFTRPSSDTGVWRGGPDVVGALDASITPELQYVVLLADEQLVVTSDSADYARRTAAVARGDTPALVDLDNAARLAAIAGRPAAATLWSGDFACDDLSDADESADTRTRWDQLVDKAGKITPVDGVVMALSPGRQLRVGLVFEDDRQARDNLDARARLAVGEAPGRGGAFADDIRLVRSRTDGSVVVLSFEPVERTGYVLSALDSGPMVFAAC